MSETKPTVPVIPDENPAVPAAYDTIPGEYADSLYHDYMMLQHQHGINGETAASWMQFASNLLNMFDGPLYLKHPEEEED